MSARYDTIIVGGGPGGCAAAIELARAGHRILLLESGQYPRQKVCGEFVSAEAMPALEELLGSNELLAGAPAIDKVRFLWRDRVAEAPVHPAARSISRAVLDDTLWAAAKKAGTDARDNITARGVARSREGFHVQTSRGEFDSRSLIDASGRWSRLRAAPPAAGAKIGIKAHVRGGEAIESVDLYFFRGGYCGVQPAGPGEFNVCALVEARVARTLPEVFEQHAALRARARGWGIVGPECTTAPVLRRRPRPVHDGILRVGDAAGFLEPLFGDGISVALRSGMLAATAIMNPDVDYAASYRRRFGRVFTGASLAGRVFALPWQAPSLLWPLLRRSPGLIGAFSRGAR